MAETVVILAALGLVIIICAALIYGAGWLIIATPLMRWLLVRRRGLPGPASGASSLRVCLDLVERTNIQTVLLEEEIRRQD